MNYVCTVWATPQQDETNYTGWTTEQLHKALLTLAGSVFQHCEATFVAHQLDSPHDLMRNKVYWMSRFAKSLCRGDRVFLLDPDTLVQADIFKVFDNLAFDLAVTSRAYEVYAPINAGVWALTVNDTSLRFMDFFYQQLHRPTWAPFLALREQWSQHADEPQWWWDQDFLCAVYMAASELPFPLAVADLGPSYNYCQNHRNIHLVHEKIGNPEYPILHFKGPGKHKPCPAT